MTIKDEFSDLLKKLRNSEVGFTDFYERTHELVQKDLVNSYSRIEEDRVREFLVYFYAYNPNAAPVQNFIQRYARNVGRVFGKETFSRDQITGEAMALEKCLNGNETSLTRFIRFFTPR